MKHAMLRIPGVLGPLLLAAASVADSAPGDVGAGPGDEPPPARWDFNTDGDAEGWVAACNIADLSVAGGRLHLRVGGEDAFIIGPAIDVPLDGCVVRLRMRSDSTGATEVFWMTDADADFSGDRRVSGDSLGCTTRPADPPEACFQTLDLTIGRPTDAGRRLTRLRVDPVNHAPPGGVQIDFIEILRPPGRLEMAFVLDRHRIDLGTQTIPSLTLRRLPGRAETPVFQVRLPDGSAQTAAPADEPVRLTGAPLRPDRPGVHTLAAALDCPGRGIRHELETSLIVGDGDVLPLTPGLRTSRLALDLIPSTAPGTVGAARWQVAPSAGMWRTAGWLLPLAEIAIQDADGGVRLLQPAMRVILAGPGHVRLAADTGPDAAWRVEVDLRSGGTPMLEAVEVQAVLTGPPGGRLLSFSGPVLRAEPHPAGEPLDRFGLFGGVEFLEPGWPSSDERAVGERFADRRTPHPFKVALPVMAVEAAELTCGLMWSPLQAWNGRDTMPAATFSSPNRLDGQPNHLMKLSVPSIPGWREENEALARRPYVMEADTPLRLEYLLYAEGRLPVALAARRWYELFSPPPPPPAPHDAAALGEIIAECYGRTIYWEQDKGWRPHWYLDRQSRFMPAVAAWLIGHAGQTGRQEWVERTGLAGRALIDAGVGLQARLAAEDQVRELIAAMRPDGTWPFANTEAARRTCRQVTAGRYQDLGEDGSTSLGTCVQAVLPVLRHARLTGDEACLAAGLRGLEATRRFRVPRGAQVWEVHQEIPDIRAAALAVEACRIAWTLTGDPQWLEDGWYWAWTGAPFLYAWKVPGEDRPARLVATRDRDDWDRRVIHADEAWSHPVQATPYASIPVLGPTFYVISWLGVPVQWCGLEWAWHVIELEAHRPDPLLRYIADGVVRSGLQQMLDRPPWTGLYPDSWNLLTNTAHVALIHPWLIHRCLEAQGRLPRWDEPWTEVRCDPAAGRRWHVSGWGRPVSLDDPTGTGPWSAVVEHIAGEPNELLLAGIRPPRRLRVEGQNLDPLGDDLGPGPGREGWCYDPVRRLLLTRFRQPRRQACITVEW